MLELIGGKLSDSDPTYALVVDAIALSNSAIQAIGCLGMRACHTNNCPVGIATQREHLRKRLIFDKSAASLEKFFYASVELMKVLSRACGHSHLNEFNLSDLSTWKKEIAELAGIPFTGVGMD